MLGRYLNKIYCIDKKIIFLALLGALVVSFIYGLPYFLIKNKLAAESKIYLPITIFSDGDEAQFYAPFIEEVAGGKLVVGDPAIKEHAPNPSLLPPLGPFFLGLAARLVGIEKTWIAADFLLPPIIFLIFFAIIYGLIGRAYISIILSGIFIFAREVASLIPFSTFQQFKTFAVYFKPYLSSAVENRLSFDRLLAPEWTFVPLGIFFLLWILSLKKQSFVLSVFSGIFFSVLFYSYPYDWISVFLILCANLFLQILSRDYGGAKFTAIAVVSGFLASIPYWISFLEISRYPQYHELLNRTGLEAGRNLRLFLAPHYILWIGSAVWLFLKKKKDQLSLAAAAIFIAAFLAMNIQVIAGFVPQPDHFLRYPLSFALFIAFVIFGKGLFGQYGYRLLSFKSYFLGFVILALALVVTRAVKLQKAYADQNGWRYTVEKPIYKSFAWMRENIAKDSVVVSPSVVTNAHLLIFTGAKVFVPSTGVITSASDKELVERFIIAAKIFGMSDEEILNLFSQNYLEKSGKGDNGDAEKFILNHLFHYGLHAKDMNSSFKAKKFRDISDIEKFAADAVTNFYKNKETMIKKYEFDYIYAGPIEKRLFSLNINNAAKNGICLNEVYNQDNVLIYERC